MSNKRVSDNHGITFLFEDVPSPEIAVGVCEGIRMVRLPLPFALDHVNCWVLGEPNNEVLIDTGIATSVTREHWFEHWGRNDTGGLARAPEKLLVTHFHPDHMGLASWFHEAGATLFGSAIETELSRFVWSIDDQDYSEGSANWYAVNGVPEAQVSVVRNNANTYRKIVRRPADAQSWTLLQEGQQVELGGHEYRVLTGRGHAPDMLMLYRASDHVLVAADQVLPSISPNVSVMPHLTDKNPLQSFLSSLQALKELPEDTLVLPSHGLPFRGLHARIAHLETHHDERLDLVRQACRQPTSAYELFSVLFHRTLDAQQTSFALGESLAHLYYLESHNELSRSTRDGVERFALI